MNDLSISTGGFYLYSLAHAAYIAQTKVKIDRIIGASAGAAIAVFSAVYGPKKMLEIAKATDLRKAYKFIPYNKKGKIKLAAYFRWAFGYPLAAQEGRPLLRSLISREAFEIYKSNHNLPEAYVLSVDLQTMKRVVTDIRACSYEKMIDRLESSMRMQGIAAGLFSEGMYLVDGGQLDHVPSPSLIDIHTDTLVSIYSWPENWSLSYMDLKKVHPAQELFRMIAGDNREKAFNDMQREKEICKQRGIRRYQIFTERHLIHPFDMDEGRQTKSINSAILSANSAFSGGYLNGTLGLAN